MADQKKGNSGKILFALLTLGILSAIAATFLLANDYRNLNRVLARFGYDPVQAHGAAPVPGPHEIRGKRIPRPRVEIPERLVSRIVPMETRFTRPVRRPPKELCEALQRTGFANAGWQEGLASGGWECTSYREFPAQRATGTQEDGAAPGEEGVAAGAEVEGQAAAPPTSAYLSIRGSQEQQLTSFRIKMNLEDERTRTAMIDAVLAAIDVYFDELRWNEQPEVLDNIRALKEFDMVVFGNRFQLKRETGEPPRYNFTITRDRARPANSYLPDYFNRDQWLPLPDASVAVH